MTRGVLIVHPSRRAAVRETLERVMAKVTAVRPGFLLWTLQTPTDPVLDHARQAPDGATFRLVPLLLAPGAHFTEDVAALADAVRRAAPTLHVTVAPALLDDADFVTWLIDRL